MKEIRILHLFPKRLSLYGEYGNLSILKKVLTDGGYAVSVTEYEEGPLSLDGMDFVYVGSGTEDALLLAEGMLSPHAEAIRQSVENGTLWVATGNAMALFGSKITRKSVTSDALGLFSYTCRIDDESRISGDVLTSDDNLFGASLVGYINTSCTFDGVDAPILGLRLNPGVDPAEGYKYRSFFATQMIGPFLVKNPPALQAFCRRLTGDDTFALPADSYAQKAYETALEELSKRV